MRALALNRAAIISTGCELARRDGLEALGIRSVASAVGVTPMALYRHVSDASDLRDAVLVCLCDSLPARPESRNDLTQWAYGLRAWLLAVPGLPGVMIARWFALPPMLDTVEGLLALFSHEGRAGFDLVAAANALFSYVLARAELEEAVRAAGVHRTLASAESRSEYPLLHSLRDHYTVARLDEHFDFGLRLMLGGLFRSSHCPV